MATLIKVDNKFINLDNVTEIHSYDLHGWNVIVYYANKNNGDGVQDFEHFTGHEADSLRDWLEHHATDVLEWHKATDNKITMYSREYAV